MKIVTTALLLNVLLASVFNSLAASPNWTDYAEVLQQVKPSIKQHTPLALVYYDALKRPGQLEEVYQQIKHFPIASLNSREEKLAFYINTYNILALKMVLDHWPVDSIKDVGN